MSDCGKVLRYARAYAGLGWKVVPISRRDPKNPGGLLGPGWQKAASDDPEKIDKWFSRDARNVGLLLGPASGVIDLEFDTDEGAALLEPFCGQIRMPAYRSKKSVHRLFKWSDVFAGWGANFSHRGVELRCGQDAAQSVLPPSVHESGVEYTWLPRLNPYDAELQPMPAELLAFLGQLRAEKESQRSDTKPRRQVPAFGGRVREFGTSPIDRARAALECVDWFVILKNAGWKLQRIRGCASDWRRPGKTGFAVSATLNYSGSDRLSVFSTSCEVLQAGRAYDKFGFICATDFNDDARAAAGALLEEYESAVSLSGIVGRGCQ